ncbi:MAG: hypothetical protein COW74_03750, partial [Piscirickettsiaceae bacterium CG18_big_fil_WC_8_21_14_2_50_44_103]
MTTDTLFFLLSKLAWAFLSPINLVIIATLLGTLLLMRNHLKLAKRILIPTSLMGLILWVYPVSDFLMQPLEKRFAQPTTLPNHI